MVAFFNRPGNHTPGNEMTFLDIDDAIARGPVLVGSRSSASRRRPRSGPAPTPTAAKEFPSAG
jgi:hypothetical protein